MSFCYFCGLSESDVEEGDYFTLFPYYNLSANFVCPVLCCRACWKEKKK